MIVGDVDTALDCSLLQMEPCFEVDIWSGTREVHYVQWLFLDVLDSGAQALTFKMLIEAENNFVERDVVMYVAGLVDNLQNL